MTNFDGSHYNGNANMHHMHVTQERREESRSMACSRDELKSSILTFKGIVEEDTTKWAKEQEKGGLYPLKESPAAPSTLCLA